MSPLEGFGRTLVLAGILILAVGVVLIVAARIPGLDRVPGDLVFRREGLTIFFPIGTMIAISVIGTLVINVVIRLFNR